MDEQNVYPDLGQDREMLRLAFERADEQTAATFEALPDRWRHPEMEPGRAHVLELEAQFGPLPEWELVQREQLDETEQLLLRRLWQQRMEEGRFPDTSVPLHQEEASQEMLAWLPEALEAVRQEAVHQPREVDVTSIWAE